MKKSEVVRALVVVNKSGHGDAVTQAEWDFIEAHPAVAALCDNGLNNFQQSHLPEEVWHSRNFTHLILFRCWNEYQDGRRFVSDRGLMQIEMSQFLDNSVQVSELVEVLDRLVGG